jgi:hypothetical protein
MGEEHARGKGQAFVGVMMSCSNLAVMLDGQKIPEFF